MARHQGFQYLRGIWNPMDILIPYFYFQSIVGCMCHSTAGSARCPQNSLGVPQIISAFRLGIGIFGIVMVCIDDPIVRSCTRDPQFPIHFKLNSEKNSVRGMVEVKTREGHHGVWDMSHYPLPANPNIYSLRLWR